MNSCTPRAISTGAQATAPLPSCRKSQAGPRRRPERSRAARGGGLAPPPEGAPRAFRVGVPAFDLFPFDTWARLQARFWRNPPADCLGYGDPAGEARLRELIAAYARARPALRGGTGDRHPWRAAGHPPVRPGVARERRSGGCKTLATARRALAFAATGAVPQGSTSTPRGCAATGSRALPAAAWPMSRRHTSTPTGVCAWRCWSGPSAPTVGSSRTTTTASIATAVRRWRRWPRWTDRAGCSTSGPSARSPSGVAPGLPGGPAGAGRAPASGGPSSTPFGGGHPAGHGRLHRRGHFQRHVRRMRRAAAPAATPCCGLARGAGLPAVAGGGGGAAPVRAGRQPGAGAGPDRRGGSRRVEVSALSDYWMDDSSVAPDDRAGLVLGFAAVPEVRIDEALRALRKAWRREALVGPVVATD